MRTDRHAVVEHALIGRRCSRVEWREYDWLLGLECGGAIRLAVPWRIVNGGRIACASEDHGHLFGLAAPLDVVEIASSILRGKSVSAVAVDHETADLAIWFEEIARLDAFNNSAGYEGWEIKLPSKEGGVWAIALGGGEVALM